MAKFERAYALMVYEIVDCYGKRYDLIRADNEREALCIYLMNHEELEDVMLWKSTDYSGGWRLAEYDNEDECLRAREAKRY